VCRFIESLPHTKGIWRQRRQLLTLQDWQCFILCAVFGFVHGETGLRRCREMFLLLPRKSGKSLLAAAIALYMLCADGEASPEVYCGATTLRQSLEVFTPAKQMVKILPAIKSAFGLQVWTQQILVEAGGKFAPVVRDPGEGQSPSCYICDEVHQHPDDKLISTFRTGTGARQQPLGVFISTAGNDISGPCYAMFEDAQKVLDGTIDRPELFCLTYGIDEDVDWASEEALRMANPGWNVSIFPEFLLTQQKNAIENARQTNAFLTRHLNVWVGQNTAFFNVATWKELGNSNLTPEDFKDCPCWLGIDLSSKVDLTACVKVFRKEIDGKTTYAVFPRLYAPEERVNDPSLPHYAQWEREGYLTATPGSMISYQQVIDDAVADIKAYSIGEVAFDGWNAGSSMERVQNETKAVTVEVPQTIRVLSEPTKMLEALILDGSVVHDGNPVLTWCMSNVVAYEDSSGNIKPNKPKDPKQKTDGAMALINALSRATTNDGGQQSNWFVPFAM
jgi:phage terminase large subunit-like protein